MQNYKVHACAISMKFSAVNRRRPSRETPLGSEAKKGGCFRRLSQRSQDGMRSDPRVVEAQTDPALPTLQSHFWLLFIT